MATRRKRAAAAVKRVAATSVQVVRAAPRRMSRSVRSAAVRVYRSPTVRRVTRQGAQTAGAVAIAQARILPGALGGYAISIIERSQRKAHAAMVLSGEGGKTPTGGALIKDPQLRLAAYLAALAYGASKTSGMVREAMIGMAGGVGALFEAYKATDGTNITDDYLGDVKAGRAGI